jgi:23S rRNA maturation-related 3'-5' exoribonuclease YhaM
MYRYIIPAEFITVNAAIADAWQHSWKKIKWRKMRQQNATTCHHLVIAS